jgi:DDE family transposase
VEERTHILNRLAGCFVDHRDPELIEHSVESLVKQRVYGIALGYEDLNDHDTLRYDALLGLLADKEDPSGAGRRRAEDRGKALAGKSTLNRLELTPKEAGKEDRYKKIVAQTEAMDRLLVEVFVESHAVPPKEIVIDVDATDDPLHGDQEGRHRRRGGGARGRGGPRAPAQPSNTALGKLASGA